MAIVLPSESFLQSSISNARCAHAAVLGLLLYPGDVLARDGVPGLHVLLHAGCEAGFLAFGERGTGLGDAAVEAVLVEFLFIN